ncbi:hypothetical protein FK85_31230 [Halorubrum saccharovorum]|uniref:Uncharacterized protein n=1 Tax=Halorubrum saccharovorum TaxID=2248 RepID=A0A0F8BG83_9EURY|nr:hypothetical protein FK85_31230 [Halorubrum saccharovorum]
MAASSAAPTATSRSRPPTATNRSSRRSDRFGCADERAVPPPRRGRGSGRSDPARDRSDYDGSRAPTGMANGNDDSRLERRIDR